MTHSPHQAGPDQPDDLDRLIAAAAFVAEQRGQAPLPFVSPAASPDVECYRCRGPKRAARLVALVIKLRAGPTTAAALSAQHGASVRTIYRDIADLRLLGVPVDRRASGGGYELVGAAQTVAGMTLDEAWAAVELLIGLPVANPMTGRARDRLLGMLPGPLVDAARAGCGA